MEIDYISKIQLELTEWPNKFLWQSDCDYYHEGKILYARKRRRKVECSSSNPIQWYHDDSVDLYDINDDCQYKYFLRLTERVQQLSKIRLQKFFKVALIEGFEKWAQRLIDNGIEIDSFNYSIKQSPLGICIRRGHVHCVRMLLTNGISVNKVGKNLLFGDVTFFHLAAFEYQMECLKILIQTCFDSINILPKIHKVVMKGDLESTKKCLCTDNHTNWNILIDDGKCTPLFWAIILDYVEIVQLLLENNCQQTMMVVDSSPLSHPLYVAILWKSKKCFNLFVNRYQTMLLQTYQDDDHSRYQLPFNPLQIAARYNFHYGIELLLKNEEIVIASNNYSPLIIATQQGHADCVKLLLTIFSANIPRRSQLDNKSESISAISIAVERSDLECLRILLQAGGKVNLRNRYTYITKGGIKIEKTKSPLYLLLENNPLKYGKNIIQMLPSDDINLLCAYLTDSHIDIEIVVKSMKYYQCLDLLFKNGAQLQPELNDSILNIIIEKGYQSWSGLQNVPMQERYKQLIKKLYQLAYRYDKERQDCQPIIDDSGEIFKKEWRQFKYLRNGYVSKA
ncbi:Ankyrin-1 [Trichoplax sp. H2]|nr:Ankyrin-1 [Trichoplax sp. H2]|eukprot:RDD46722.1 Ankyrin-1 [Trichoplax sp. H2]